MGRATLRVRTAVDVLTDAHNILLNSWSCSGSGDMGEEGSTACAMECIALADGLMARHWFSVLERGTKAGADATTILADIIVAERLADTPDDLPINPSVWGGRFRVLPDWYGWRFTFYDDDEDNRPDENDVAEFNDRPGVDLQIMSDLFEDAIEEAKELGLDHVTTTRELGEDEIAARLAELTTARLAGLTTGDCTTDLLWEQHRNSVAHDLAALARAGEARARYRFVRPLVDAADSLIEYLQNSEGRIMLGLREVDIITRGFGPGELIYLTGYTHSGKTQVFLSMVCANRDRRFVLFTMDEPAELVLTKLVCMRTRSNAERLEERVKNGDQQAIDRVRRIAREDFANLIVIDQSMRLSDFDTAIKEAEDFWGAKVDGIGVDYLELLRCDDHEVERKSQELKGWAVGQSFPTICLHQGSRGNSAGGQRLTMRSMKYGGEQEGIMVLGVRRQRDDEDLDELTRQRHADTVDVSVIKNKRPPSKLGEFTFYMDPNCGLVLPYDEMPSRSHEALTSAAGVRRLGQSPGQMDFDGNES